MARSQNLKKSDSIATVESQPSFSDKLKAFGREYGWLCGGAFAALLVATAEGRKPEARELSENRRAIAELPSDRQQQLQLHAVSYQQLRPDEQTKLQAIHQVAIANDELSTTAHEYHQWLDGLSKEQRNRIAQAKTDIERLSAIREIRESGDGPEREPGFRPNGTPSFRPGENSNKPFRRPSKMVRELTSMLVARGKTEMFLPLLEALGQAVKLPEPMNATPLQAWEHHAQVIDQAMTTLPIAGENSLRDIIRRTRANHVPADIQEKFPLDGARIPDLLLAQLVAEGLTVIRRDEKLRTQVWLQLPGYLRRDLQNMPSDEADLHIVIAHLRPIADTVQKQLVGLYFEDNRGFGGNGPGGNGPGGPEDFGPGGPGNGGPGRGPGNRPPEGPRGDRPRNDGPRGDGPPPRGPGFD